MIGALYLDGGVSAIDNVFLDIFNKSIEDFTNIKSLTDHKSKLQEILQKNTKQLPKYEVIKEEGPEHQKAFHVKVSMSYKGEEIFATGIGLSKKDAQQEAAKLLLEKIIK